METVTRFTVYGEAAPQGSKRGFVIKRANGSHGVAMVESSREVKSWRQQVAAAACQARASHKLATGPIRLELHFFRSRPKTHYGSGKRATRVKDSAPRYPVSKPDVDKLTRAIGDALTGILWRDDSQVVSLVACKHWGVPERCEVAVYEIDETSERESEAA